jgi:hypothetical protein
MINSAFTQVVCEVFEGNGWQSIFLQRHIHIPTDTKEKAVGRLLSGVPFKHFTRAKNLIDAIVKCLGEH